MSERRWVKGFHKNVSFAEYLSCQLVSNSAIKIGREMSMHHMREYVEGRLRGVSSRALKFGSAVHCYVFERDRFEQEYHMPGKCHATKKNGDPCGNDARRRKGDGTWVCGTHGKGLDEADNIISQSDAEAIQGMSDRITNSEVGQFLKSGVAELTVVEEINGVLCKGRFDWMVLGASPPVIVDLKKITMGRGRQPLLLRSIRDYGYDVGAALYTRLFSAVMGDRVRPPRFLWLFVEDAPPYSIIPRYASQEMIEVGGAKLDRALDDWKECVESSSWPSYGDAPLELDPEPWEYGRVIGG